MKWEWWESKKQERWDMWTQYNQATNQKQNAQRAQRAQADIHHAENEIQRLIEKRTMLKHQLRDMPDLIEAQFEIINKAKALIGETK